ncbi:hypothetical protein LCGC14_2034760 [marine sediment metagenome]|uniref:Uncharacterized protein n=1 Tax=marine sediment metagenome TaxID=412755 RepID=A0A0F9ETW1_9ZZZZ
MNNPEERVKDLIAIMKNQQHILKTAVDLDEKLMRAGMAVVILDGTLCAGCGEFLEFVETEVGHPVYCPACIEEDKGLEEDVVDLQSCVDDNLAVVVGNNIVFDLVAILQSNNACLQDVIRENGRIIKMITDLSED